MSQVFVSFDLETTGLEPSVNEILEFGAVRIVDGKITEEFASLVHPRVKIPTLITNITGIDDKMVADSPPFEKIYPEFLKFIGDAVLIAHNIDFDIGILNGILVRYNLPKIQHATIDTQSLSGFFYPTLASQRLTSVAKILGITVLDAHRALADARLAAEIFLHLLSKVEDLSPTILHEINQLTSKIEFPLRDLFIEAEHKSLEGVSIRKRTSLFGWSKLITDCEVSRIHFATEEITDQIKPIPLKDITSYLTTRLHAIKPNYETRAGQQQLAREVVTALNDGTHLIAEAGTGTGKSLAYLIPAAAWAEQNHQHVVIATKTKTLQSQLRDKDIPLINEVLGTTISVALLKGRENYLCLRRFENYYRNSLLRPDRDELLLPTLLHWLEITADGDLEELHPGTSSRIWRSTCAEHATCLRDKCQHYHHCFLFQARRQARQSRIILINHALLCSDLLQGGGLLRNYHHLIIDEAHSLEESVTDASSITLSRLNLQKCFSRLLDSRSHLGVLSDIRKFCQLQQLDYTLASGLSAQIEQSISNLTSCFERLLGHCEEFIYTYRGQAQQLGLTISEYTEVFKMKLNANCAQLPHWNNLIREKTSFQEELNSNANLLMKLSGVLADYFPALPPNSARSRKQDPKIKLQSLTAELSYPLENANLISEGLNTFFSLAPDWAHWFEVHNKKKPPIFNLCCAPVAVRQILRENLLSQRSLILTSATLTVNRSFDYVSDRLGFDEEVLNKTRLLLLPPEFNYQEQALLCLPEDVPSAEDKSSGYAQKLAQWLLPILVATHGRALMLFTSYKMLNDIYHHLRHPAEAAGLRLLAQGPYGGSRRTILDRFTNEPDGKFVIMGTDSFWEGIDIPGATLSAVIVMRLPFSVPTDPIYIARSEEVESRGLSSFQNYALPQAALKFKQGLGRLIRTRSDRGIIVVADSRITTKSYGQAFLNSLPDYHTVKSGQGEILEMIKSWI